MTKRGRKPGAVSPFKLQREAMKNWLRRRLKKRLAKLRQEIRRDPKETGKQTIDAEYEALEKLFEESQRRDKRRAQLGAADPLSEKTNTHPGELVGPAPAGLGVRSIGELDKIVYPRRRKKTSSTCQTISRKRKKPSLKMP